MEGVKEYMECGVWCCFERTNVVIYGNDKLNHSVDFGHSYSVLDTKDGVCELFEGLIA